MRNSLISKIITLSFAFAFVACADIDGAPTAQSDLDGGSKVNDGSVSDEPTISAVVLNVTTNNGVEKAQAFVTVTSSGAPDFVSIQCTAPTAELTGNTFNSLLLTPNTNQRTGLTEFTVQPNVTGYTCKVMAGFGAKLIVTTPSPFNTPPLNSPPQPVNSISATCVPVGATEISCAYLATFVPSTLWVQAYTPQELSLNQIHTGFGTVMAAIGTVRVGGLTALTTYATDVVATVSGSQQQYKSSSQVTTLASTGVIPTDAATITLDTTDVTVQAGSIVPISGGFTNAAQITCVNQIDRSVLPVALGVDQWFTSLKVDVTAVVVCIAFNSANKPTNPVTKKFIVPSVTADITAPIISNVQPPMNSVVTTPFVAVTGTIADQNGVTKVTATSVSPVQSYAVSITGTAPNQTFSFVVPAGNNSYTIIAQDASGNTAVYNEILAVPAVVIPTVPDATITLDTSDVTVQAGSVMPISGSFTNATQITCVNQIDRSTLPVVLGSDQWFTSLKVDVTAVVVCIAYNTANKPTNPVTKKFIVPSVTADTIAPIISNVQPPTNSVVTTAFVTVTGAIADQNGVTKMTATGVSPVQTYAVSITGTAPNQTFSFVVPAGNNSYTIIAQDASGNTAVYNEILTVPAVVNPTVGDPTITATSIDAIVTAGSLREVKGTSTNAVQIKCQNRVDGNVLLVQGPPDAWSATVQVNTTAQIGCVAINASGKSSVPAVNTFTVLSTTSDTVAPIFSNVQPPMNSVVTTMTVTVTGAVADQNGVTKMTAVNAVTNQVHPVSFVGTAPNQTFSVVVATPATSNSFIITAQDASGNTAVYNEVILNTGGGVITPPTPTGSFTLSCGSSSVYVLNPSMPLVDNSGTHFNESQPGQTIIVPAATFCGGPMFDSSKSEVFEAICVNRSNNTWTSQGFTVTRPDGTSAPLRTGLNNGNNLMATPADLGCTGTNPPNGGNTGLVVIPSTAVLNANGGIVVIPSTTQAALQFYAGALTDGTISGVSFSPQILSNLKLEVANDQSFTSITKTLAGTNGTTSQFIVPTPKVSALTTIYMRVTGTDAANHQLQSAVVSAQLYPFAIGFNPVAGSNDIYATGKVEIVDISGQTNSGLGYKTPGTGSELAFWVLNQVSLTRKEVCGGGYVNMSPVPIRLMLTAKSGAANIRVYRPNGQLFMVNGVPVLPAVADSAYRHTDGWDWVQVDDGICQ